MNFADHVVLAIEADGFFHYRGKPVWPIRNANEKYAFETMVRSLGGEIELVFEVEEEPLSGREMVVGLGTESHEDAKLYAHLTKRHYNLVHDLIGLRKLPRPAVVVTTIEYVDERLFDFLYVGAPLDSAPGVVFSFGHDLRKQVLARSVAVQLIGARVLEKRRVDINALVDCGAYLGENYSFLGSRSTPAEFREAIASNPGLLSLTSHSDGIDVWLGRDLVLCPIRSADVNDHTHPAPSCVISGICHRCSRRMSQVVGSDRLLHPDAIRAHVMIFCVCWGLYPSRSVHSTDSAFSRAVLENLSVGALLTSWEINIQDLSDTTQLFHNVLSGMTLGEALAIHLSSHASENKFHNLCLIGDPSIRLAKSDAPDPFAHVRNIRKMPAPSARCIAALTLLRLILNCFEGAESSEAMESIVAYEKMLIEGIHYNENVSDRFRQRGVGFLSSHDTMVSKVWTSFADPVEVLPERKACPICGRRTITRKYIMRLPGAAPRCETMCPSCGSVSDLPSDLDLSMSVEADGTIHLNGDFRNEHWHARVVVERFHTNEKSSWIWPEGDDGKPLRSFRVPEPFPSIPFRLGLVFIVGQGELIVLGCLYRGTSNETVRLDRPTISLQYNENPESVAENVTRAVLAGSKLLNRYPFDTTARVLRRLSAYYDCAEEKFMLVRGIDECLDHLCREFSEMHFATVWPGFDAFQQRVKLLERRSRQIRLNSDFNLLKDDLSRLGESDFALVANPSNPTGLTLSDEEKQSLTSNAGWVLFDETYIDYAGGCFNKVEFQDNVITFRSFSKSLGLAGARLGIMFGAPSVLNRMKERQLYCNVGVLDLHALEQALDNEDRRQQHVEMTIRERERLRNAIARTGTLVYDSAANFLLVKSKPQERLGDFLASRGIRVKDTAQFGIEDHVRISVGTEQENDRLIDAFLEYTRRHV